jgi:hypothetical protein
MPQVAERRCRSPDRKGEACREETRRGDRAGAIDSKPALPEVGEAAKGQSPQRSIARPKTRDFQMSDEDDYLLDCVYDELDEDDYDPGEDCGRWINCKLTRSCSLAGTEFCDFECPYRKGLYTKR